MFGFFKSKSKDKVASKDKAEDKKKDNKEDIKINLKGKDEKSKSIFRKSRSSERSQEDLSAKAKSKSLKNLDRRSGSHEAPKAKPESHAIGDCSDDRYKLSNRGNASEESSESSAFTEISTSASKVSVDTELSDSQNPSSSSNYKAKSLSPPSTLNYPNKKDSRARNQSFGGLGSIASNASIGKQPPSRSISDGGVTVFPVSTIDCESSVSSLLASSATSLEAKPPLKPKPISSQTYTRPQPPRGPVLASKTSSTSTTITADISCAKKDDMAIRKHYPSSPSISSPPSSPGLSLTHSMPSVHDPAYRSVSPDGRMSMLSTPSSSTSSLTSISSRPISPSGRRTPPGPRMGTGGRLSSSPTPTRKATRTNIKTNPVTRRGGSVSPVNHLPSNSRSHINNIPLLPSMTSLSTPTFEDNTTGVASSSPTVIVIPFIDGFNSPPSSPPITRSNQTFDSTISYTQIKTPASVNSNVLPAQLSVHNESKSDSSSSSSRSVSPSNVKSRHSVASMHSLESIPENDSDSQISTNESENKDHNEVTSKSKIANCSTTISNKETKYNEGEKDFIDETNHLLSTGSKIVSDVIEKSRENNDDPKKSSFGAIAALGRSDSIKQKEFKKMKERIENEKSNTPNTVLPAVKEEYKTSTYQGTRTIDILSRNTKSAKSKSSEKVHDNNSYSPKHLESNKSKLPVDSLLSNNSSNSHNIQLSSNKTELQSNSSKSKQSFDPDASHFVFNIPMKVSTSNKDNLHKRHSLEIMQKEDHHSTKSSKEARNLKAKSASFCQEPQRGKGLETPFGVKRSASSGPSGILPSSPTLPQKRDRHRSLSRTRQRSKEAEAKAKLSDSDDEVIIPWRRRPRSTSRKNISCSNTIDNQINKKDNSTKDQRNRSSSRGRADTDRCPNKIDHSKSESTINAYLQGEKKSYSSSNNSSKGNDKRKANLDSIDKTKLYKLELDSLAVHSTLSSSISDETPESCSRSKNNSESSTKSSMLGSSSRQSSKSSSRPSSADISSISIKSSSKCQDIDGSVYIDNLSRKLSESVQSDNICDNDYDSVDSEDMVTVVPLKSLKIKKSQENINSKNDDNNIVQNNIQSQEKNENLQGKSYRTGHSKHRDSHRPRRRSVSLQTHVIKSTSKQSQTNINKENLSEELQQLENNRKELATQEERYQKQVDGLTIKLAANQEEVTSLKQQLETLKGVKDRLSGAEDIQSKLNDLQKTLHEKNAQMDGLRVELQYSRNEVELTKTKLKKLEEDLDSARQKNSQLQTQITSNNNVEKLSVLETKIAELEDQLHKVEEDRDRLKENLQDIEVERDEELKIIQDALDEAAQEREELIATFEKEIEGITTINQNREHQLMEDFENKLREIERDHKNKIEERDRIAETLTRGRRQTEDSETEFQQRLEKTKSEVNAEWEDKLRSECSRLKTELDSLHSEEKQLAVDTMRVQKEHILQTAKRDWDTAKEDLSKEISTLKDRLTEKEVHMQKEMDSQRTLSDREIWDLRRKLQKLDEKMWTQKEAYEEKIMRMTADYQDQIKDMQMRLKLCENPPTSKSELEAVYKQQMQHLADQHTASMERLQEELEADKYAAIEEARVLVSKHLETVNATLREQLSRQTKSNEKYRGEMDTVHLALKQREEAIHLIEEEHNKLRYSKGLPPSASRLPELQASYEAAIAQFAQSSEDRLSELNSSLDSQDDASKSGSGGLFGKMFGVGWFSNSKSKDSRRNSRHST